MRVKWQSPGFEGGLKPNPELALEDHSRLYGVVARKVGGSWRDRAGTQVGHKDSVIMTNNFTVQYIIK